MMMHSRAAPIEQECCLLRCASSVWPKCEVSAATSDFRLGGEPDFPLKARQGLDRDDADRVIFDDEEVKARQRPSRRAMNASRSNR